MPFRNLTARASGKERAAGVVGSVPATAVRRGRALSRR